MPGPATSSHPGQLPADQRLHLTEPDYTRPLLAISPEQETRILDLFSQLYHPVAARANWPELSRLMKVYAAHQPPDMAAWEAALDPADRFSQKDVVVITYGDILNHPHKPPLAALEEFLDTFLKGAVNTVHILPFYPYSSDRGFAVIDFREVDPALGTWEDIAELSKRFRLMFDAVFNHVSSQNRWFRQFRDGDPAVKDYFIAFKSGQELTPDQRKLILRPRTSDVLTEFRTIDGPRFVWTTFSPDQIDLNYKNPQVFLEVVKLLLYYVWRGADLIRLDAVTYMWAELGTSCALLDQTHVLVKLFRAVLDVTAPHVALITETNVPHEANLRYFGDGADEAQMVYNFALPPLVLHAFITGNAATLSHWAAGLATPSAACTFFNFLDSHDGVGLMPVKEILSRDEVERLVDQTLEHGGLVSYKSDADGGRSPYELNITWYSALNHPDSQESLALQVRRFLASRAIALTLAGVPGIYLPSLGGALNDVQGVRREGEFRSINRARYSWDRVEEALTDPHTSTGLVAQGFSRLIQLRVANPCFHPRGRQEILAAHHQVFACLRWSPDGSRRTLALTNVANAPAGLSLTREDLYGGGDLWPDQISGAEHRLAGGRLNLDLEPYQIMWLEGEVA
ncbi:MAG: sugar phosphorylase [Deltaproteobacteria bacterium]|nr:sugar phosphorylase [Deltaproteobacteria bacterium]